MYLKKIRKNKKKKYFTLVYQNSWWYHLVFLRYTVQQTEIGNYGSIFCPSTPPSPLKIKKIKMLKKWKKHLEMSLFYTRVPKITIIWYMLPEIWSGTSKSIYEWIFVQESFVLSLFVFYISFFFENYRVQLNRLWCLIYNKALNFHNWLLYHHDPFHNKIKR